MAGQVDAKLIVELMDRHARQLELYASRWTTTPEDCVQEALVELSRQAEVPTEPVAWLFLAVRRRALNASRSRRRRNFHEGVAAQLVETRSATQLSAEDRLSLPEALAMLPPDEHELVVLRIWGELTWEQIAQVLETSSSTAQRRYVAALERMKQRLEPPCLPKITCPNT